MNTSILAQVLRILALVPLLAYPAVLVANAMQAAALLESKKRGAVAASGHTSMSIFLGGTTIYPLVTLLCQALAAKASDTTHELAWSAAPLVFLGALAGLFARMVKRDDAS